MDFAALLGGNMPNANIQKPMPVGVHPDSILSDALVSREMQQPGYNPLAPKRTLPSSLEAALAQDARNAQDEPSTGLTRDAAGQRDAMLKRFSTVSIDPATRKVTQTGFGPQSNDMVQRGASTAMGDIVAGRLLGQYNPREQTASFSSAASPAALLHETEHGVTNMAARDIAAGNTRTSDRLPFVQQMAALADAGHYAPDGSKNPAWRTATGTILDELHSHMADRGPDSAAQWEGAKNFLFDSPRNAYPRQVYGDMVSRVSPGVGLGFRAIGKLPVAGEALGDATQLGPALSGIGPTARGVAGAVGDVAGGIQSAGGRLWDALGGK